MRSIIVNDAMDKKELLQRSSLFAGISAEDLDEIASACESVSIKAGEYIYKKGTQGDFFYVVLEGEVELVARRDDNSTCTIGQIGEGGHFGETSLLTGEQRSLSVRAVTDALLGKFSGEFFLETLLANSIFHKELDKVLVTRLSSTQRDQVETTFDRAHHFVQFENTDLYPFFESGGELADNTEDPAPRTLKNVQAGIRKFAGNLELSDDITIVALRCVGTGN